MEESAKINEEYDEDSDDPDSNGFHRVMSISAKELDFSHAIPPSLGSPPPPPLHTRKDSLNALSPIPSSAPFDFREPLQRRSASLDSHLSPKVEDLEESDNEFTLRNSLADRIAHLLDGPAGHAQFFDIDLGAGSPMASTPHDMDHTGPPSPSVGSPTPGSKSASRLNFEKATMDKRFFGKSSAFTILKTAVDMRSEYWRSAGIVGGSRASLDNSSGVDSPDQSHDDHGSGPSTAAASPEGQSEAPPGEQNSAPTIEYLTCGCPTYGKVHPVSGASFLWLYIESPDLPRLFIFYSVGVTPSAKGPCISPCFSHADTHLHLLRHPEHLCACSTPSNPRTRHQRRQT